MSLVAGTFYNSGSVIPSATTHTFSVTQDAGSGKILTVFIANESDSSAAITSVTYGGQTMTLNNKVQSQTIATDYYYSYTLANSSVTGANNLVVTWNAAQYNKTGLTAQSFTGSNGIGTSGLSTSTSPTTVVTFVSANSIVLAWAFMTGGSTSTSWTGANALWFDTLDNWNAGAITTNLSAGAHNIVCSPLYNNPMTLIYLEIKAIPAISSKNTQFILL